MLYNYLTSFSLVNQSSIVMVLIAVVVFFSILLILGVRKSYKLKKENEKLNEMDTNIPDEDEQYRDFTEGHMYDNNE